MMGRRILFGAAYYPEYMPYDRITEDLQMMKAAGMNTIRIAESTWSTLEPAEGVFDFGYIDRTLAAAAEFGMQVIIGTPTYAIPAWMVKKAPAVMVEKKAGRAAYGHRQLMDITNPDFLYYAERIIRKLAEHTASHPSVIGFQIDNETKHYDGYSETVQKGFVEYLKETFETPEQLNRSLYLAYWSNSIHSWADFPDMRGCVHGGLAGLYDRYRRDLVTKYLRWQAGVVRAYRREGQFITHNLDFEWKKFGADIAQDGYSYGVQSGVHHADVAKFLDLPGTDIYHPTQDQLTGAEIAFGGDEIRSLKGENYLVLENQAQAFKYWTPYPGQLKLHAYSHLASGAMGTMYWSWHSIHNGYETYWRGVLSHDLSTNPVYEEAAVIGREWQRIGAERLVLRKQNAVALVVDNASLSAFQWFPIDREVSYNDVVRYMYDSLYELNVECDVVFADELEPERYRMIVTPALYCAEEDLLNRLDAFVKQGGVLVSSFRSFVADKNGSVYPDVQPHILHACLGLSYSQFTEPGTATVNGYPVKAWADLLVAKEATVFAHYEHPYWNRYAAVTENSYGKGYACYLGCYADKTVLKDIYRKALAKASMDDQLARISWEAPVIVRSGINGAGRRVHYVFHYSSQNTELTCPYETVMDLLTGKIYEQGDIISLKDWDVVVLEEQNQNCSP